MELMQRETEHSLSREKMIDDILFLSYAHHIPSPGEYDLMNCDDERLRCILNEMKKHLFDR